MVQVRAGDYDNAALDPFSLYEKGEASLRRRLDVLSTEQLVNIITAHRFIDEPVTVLNSLPALMLSDFIVMGVRDHAFTCKPASDTNPSHGRPA